MSKPSGLGKGLGSLIPNKLPDVLPKDSSVAPGDERVIRIPLSQIVPNPHQPRTTFGHDDLEDLTKSIKEHGILQPLIVSKVEKGYQLIAGERRFRAAQILELASVPAIVREADKQQHLELAIVENVQRSNLNPIEEAVAYQRLIDEFSLTQEEVAQKVGKSRSVVANTLRLLALPSEIQRAVITGQITYSTARVIAGLPIEQRMPFFKKVIKEDLTTRAAEGAAKQVTERKTRPATSKDPLLAAMEDQLQGALGTKVSIKKSGQSGLISIEFYSDEELQGLISQMVE